MDDHSVTEKSSDEDQDMNLEYDKQYAWEALQAKYFAVSLDDASEEAMIEMTIEQLKDLSDDSYEYGRLRERGLGS